MECDASERDFQVLYLSEREAVRDWSVVLSDYEDVLPVLWQRRNSRTPTSDTILNYGFLTRALKPDSVIVFGYNYLTYMLVALARAIMGRETILFCETTLAEGGNKGFRSFVKRAIFKVCFHRFIVPGQNSFDYLRSHGVASEKIFRAINASPLGHQRLCSERSESAARSSPDGVVRLLFVGRLSPEKRIVEFIDALSRVEGGYSLTVVGDGPQRDAVLEVAARDSRVHYLGPANTEELEDIYSSHDALILVSSSEPWGLVVNEAVNFGLALLLARNVGCAPELLDRNGVMLEALSSLELQAKLAQLRTDLDLFKQRSRELSVDITPAAQARAFFSAVGA